MRLRPPIDRHRADVPLPRPADRVRYLLGLGGVAAGIGGLCAAMLALARIGGS
ncbi:MAG: hypothetical protein ACKOTZ_08835 [Chloroflexota bacterium]